MSIESAKVELLLEGLDDMLTLSWIISVVAGETGAQPRDQDKVMQPALDIIYEFLQQEWAIAGDVVEAPQGLLEVRSWNLPAERATQRIKDEWLGLDEPPHAGDVVWLELTEKGRAHARSLED
jgi:hypothetical protein